MANVSIPDSARMKINIISKGILGGTVFKIEGHVWSKLTFLIFLFWSHSVSIKCVCDTNSTHNTLVHCIIEFIM